MGRRHAPLPGPRSRALRRRRARRGRAASSASRRSPSGPKSDLIPIGVYFLRPDAFDVIEHLAPSGRGRVRDHRRAQPLHPRRRPLLAGSTTGHWTDAGTVPSLQRAAQLAAEDDADGRLARAAQRPSARDGPGTRARAGAEPGRRLLVTGGAGFIGSCFVRDVLGSTRRDPDHRPGHADLRRDEANLARSTPTRAGRQAALRPRRHRRPGARRRARRRGRRDRQLRRRVARRPLDPRSGGVPAHRRDRRPRPARRVSPTVGRPSDRSATSRSRPTRSTARSRTGSSIEGDRLAPRSPYAAAKAAGELLAARYHVTHGLDAVVTRGSNTYGPYHHPEKLIPLFVTNALDDLPLPLYGDGLQDRDWLHVADHAGASSTSCVTAPAARPTTCRARTELPEPRGRPADPRAARQALVARPHRRRTGPATTAATPWTARRSRALGWRTGRLRGRARGHRRLVLANEAVVAGRASRATGTPTTSASTASGWPWPAAAAGRSGGGAAEVRVAVTGAGGRLGRALLAAPWPTRRSRGLRPLAWGRPDYDLDDPAAAARLVGRDRPEVVVHAAAWTDVDGCAREPDLAMRRTATATGVARRGLRGARDRPRRWSRPTRSSTGGAPTGAATARTTRPPGNPYGASKLAGELRRRARAPTRRGRRRARLAIVRTAWLFGPPGGDFPAKILAAAERAAAAGEPLRVVGDEFGSPTVRRRPRRGHRRAARSGDVAGHRTTSSTRGAVSRAAGPARCSSRRSGDAVADRGGPRGDLGAGLDRRRAWAVLAPTPAAVGRAAAAVGGARRLRPAALERVARPPAAAVAMSRDRRAPSRRSPGVRYGAVARHGDERGSFRELWRASAFRPTAGPTGRGRLDGAAVRPGEPLHLGARRPARAPLPPAPARLLGRRHRARLRRPRRRPAGRRRDGPTRRVETRELARRRRVMIPAGVAHGFLALEPLELVYLVTNEFDGSDELGFAWDDPAVGVPWPRPIPGPPTAARSSPSATGRTRRSPTWWLRLRDWAGRLTGHRHRRPRPHRSGAVAPHPGHGRLGRASAPGPRRHGATGASRPRLAGTDRPSGPSVERRRTTRTPTRAPMAWRPPSMRRIAAALAAGLVVLAGLAVPATAAAAARRTEGRDHRRAAPARRPPYYKTDADAAYAEARKYTSNVVKVYSPERDLGGRQGGLQGASIVIYMGHGNGFPSPYRTTPGRTRPGRAGAQPHGRRRRQQHQVLRRELPRPRRHPRPERGRDPQSPLLRVGQLRARQGRAAPSPWRSQRVDNFAAGFLRAGARAVIADGHCGPAWYVQQLFTTHKTVDQIWHGSPTFNDQRSPSPRAGRRAHRRDGPRRHVGRLLAGPTGWLGHHDRRR